MSKPLKLNERELPMLQRNALAREMREMKIEALDRQVVEFETELRDAVQERLGVDVSKYSINTKTGEMTEIQKINSKAG